MVTVALESFEFGVFEGAFGPIFEVLLESLCVSVRLILGCQCGS